MMSDLINKKEKLLLEYLITNREIFIQAYGILKDEYFEPPLNQLVSFTQVYFAEYHNLPTLDMIEAETSIVLKNRPIDADEKQWVLDEIESHCQKSAAQLAILASVDLVETNQMQDVLQLMKDVVTISINRNVGTDLFDDPKSRIEMTGIGLDERGIGIPEFDDLIGNIRRGELVIVMAGTSVGKSVTLGNFATLLAHQKLDCLIVSVEMNEDMYSRRLDSLVSGVPISKNPDAEQIANALSDVKDEYGRIVTKRVGSSFGLNDLRSLIMEYHLKYGKYPDSLLLDYIDIFSNGNIPRGVNGKHEWDEVKTHSLRDMMEEFNMYGFSASQMNRDSYGVTDISVSHIAGGISKANGADTVVALVETDEDRENDSWTALPVKLRNGSKNPNGIKLYRCPKTLRISGKGISSVTKHSSPVPSAAKKKQTTSSKEGLTSGKGKDKLRSALNLK
jgi:hypothetical protein